MWVEDRKVSDIVAGDLPPENIDQGAARPVFDELKKMREARIQRELNRGVARDRQDLKPKPGVVIMEMDKSHNFKLMRRIMLAAQQAEFVTFKLMVTKPTE
jgi:biopolymer transport protein ExbD